MATTTYHEYTGDGSATQFNYSFEPIKIEDVKVALNGVTQTTGYTATLSPAKVTFTSAPASGVQVRVYRDTDVDSPKAVYAAGSSIRALDLNNNHDQVLYALQEEQNQKGIFEEIKLDDGVKIKLGNSDDFTIEYDGSDAILETTSGDIEIDAKQWIRLKINAGNLVDFMGSGSGSSARVNTTWRPYTDDAYDLGSSSYQWKDLYIDGTAYLDTVDIDAGAIDGTTIGANSASTGAFTTLTTSSNATINGNIVVTGTISDSGGNLELADDVNISGDIHLLDSKKVYLGTSDDASIYWDGTGDEIGHEFIMTSTGPMKLSTGSNKNIQFAPGGTVAAYIGSSLIETKVNILPNADGTIDLGSSSKEWKDLYVDGTGYIDTVSADTVDADNITGSAVVTTGTSTSDTKVYSAKHSDALFLRQDTSELIKSGDTWSADDIHVASTAAIDARIVDLVDDVGGFVPIANETSFPNANPDVNNGTGTLVSVPLANNVTSNGSGVISISNGTVGNSTVTINGAANSTTYTQGFGIIVETTTTLNTYTFHRYVPKATEVTTVAGSIANVNTTAGAIANVNTVAGISGNVTTVAGISANVTTVANDGTDIGTVAGSIANVNTTAGSISNVNTTAGSIANVNTTAGSIANVNTTAGSISNVNTVGNNIDNVNTVAGIDSDVTAVAGDAADIGACSTNIGSIAAIGSDLANNFENITDYGSITGAVTSTSGTSDITTVANSITNVNTVAGKNTEIGRLGTADAVADMVILGTTDCVADMAILATADVVTDLNTLGTADVVSDMNTLATAAIVSDMDTLADISSNISTVSSNNSNVTTCANNIADINNASTNAANALAYRNSALTYRNEASSILTQVESAPYNLADNVSSHTAWGDITDTGANAVFTNESSNILLTMAEGSSSYNYGSIT